MGPVDKTVPLEENVEDSLRIGIFSTLASPNAAETENGGTLLVRALNLLELLC